MTGALGPAPGRTDEVPCPFERPSVGATTWKELHSMSATHTIAVRRGTLAAVGTVAALTLALAGCGASSGSESADSATHGMNHGPSNAASANSPSSQAPSGSGAFNDADVTFAQQMIPHHQQAVEMARLADGRAADAEVKSLASTIQKAQDPEIATMKGWLKAWGKPLPSASSSMGDMPGMHHGSSGTAGMMSDQDMSALKSAKGKDFDKKFAELMVGHHQGAITMAKDEQSNGTNPDAKKLAGNVIAAQNAEIEQMNKIVERLR
ncbi:DUF305 domain-containing protein [Streptomyces sp. CB01201]|uniref:DUF305 domain-containing protein n=2 Tax=Streptomyces TaxID=1883 RepID=UPI002699C8BB|nr:DUF305 domain-containing protein [Streptomyces sp. CB01201]